VRSHGVEAGDTKSSQGFHDASDEGVEVRRDASCSGLRNEFEAIEVEAAIFHDQVELAVMNAEQLAPRQPKRSKQYAMSLHIKGPKH